MKAAILKGAMAAAIALAIPAAAQAGATYSTKVTIEESREIHAIGYRYDRWKKFNGGISYTSDTGLRYAPTYWPYRDADEVEVRIYAGPRELYRTRRHTKPLIVELP